MLLEKKSPTLDGPAFRLERRAAKLALKQIAHRSGYSTSYLSDVERGLRAARGQTARNLAEALALAAERKITAPLFKI